MVSTLELPSWTPAGSVIGAVWTVIFFLIAVSVLVFWNRGKRNRMFWAVVAIFLVNAFLNVFWSYLFFSKNLLFWAFIDTILLEISILALIIMLRPFSVTASALLWPYAGWVAFASYLNYSIWQLNLLA